MPDLKPIKLKPFLKYLELVAELELVSVTGSHHKFNKKVKPKLIRPIIIAIHNQKEIPGQYVYKIVKQLGKTLEEFESEISEL